MVYLAVALIIGALWLGFKIGTDSGRTALLEAQSLAISVSLESNNEFFLKTGLHGSYLLEGHEYRSPTDYVIVKFSDLECRLAQVPISNDDDAEYPKGEDEQSPAVERIYVPSEQLAKLTGEAPLTRTEATKKVWEYIEINRLQDAKRSIQINCDDLLSAITGASTCTMFALTKHIGRHLHEQSTA